ncbi:MAG: CHAD domain-containing protein [Solirubrobacteraceae bacterium]|nr:CHAD domain-containing protein [Solirubrobacteraceae bacterium]
MRPRRVKRLDPQGALADNAQRIVLTRLDELCGFVPAVLDPRAVRELHDMRIAAKRLRYVLEVTAGSCFGPYARVAAKRAKELQDLLGEIHDCDVQLPRVEALALELRDADAAELRSRAGDAPDLDPQLAVRLPHGDSWRGLITLKIYLRARRDLLYERFTAFWRELERDGFRARLEYAVRERPEAVTPSVAPEEGLGSAESKPRLEPEIVRFAPSHRLEPAARPGLGAPTSGSSTSESPTSGSPVPEPPVPAGPPAGRAAPLAPTMASGAPEAPVGPVASPPPPPAPTPAPSRPAHRPYGGIHPTIPIGSPEAPTGPPAPDPDELPEDRE